MKVRVPRIELGGFYYAKTAGACLDGKGQPPDERMAPLSALAPRESGPPSAPDLEGAAAVNMADVILTEYGEMYTLHTNCVSAAASLNYETTHAHIDIVAVPLGLSLASFWIKNGYGRYLEYQLVFPNRVIGPSVKSSVFLPISTCAEYIVLNLWRIYVQITR